MAYVVYAIENDCQLCPVGSFKMIPTHQVRRNEAFKGLSHSDATNLNNYMHFRNVQTQQQKEDLNKPSAPFNERFLEPLVNDLPRGLWSI